MYYENICGTDNILGAAISAVTSNAKYPLQPDHVDTLTSGYFETQLGYGDKYVAMLEGWLVAPVTGLLLAGSLVISKLSIMLTIRAFFRSFCQGNWPLWGRKT